jgi:hypothetical protein
MGTLGQSGVLMDVKAVVAVLDERPALVVYLLPFLPDPAETAKLQAEDDLFWISDKASPDPKKWKSCPHGSITLSWGIAKPGEVGDARKAAVYVYSSADGSSLTTSKVPGDVQVAVAGPVKVGQDITLTSKGSDTVGGKPMTWNLSLKAKVVAKAK